MNGTLTLFCAKCTRESRFAAPTVKEAGEKAVKAGWVLTHQGLTMKENKYACPKCPAQRGFAE